MTDDEKGLVPEEGEFAAVRDVAPARSRRPFRFAGRAPSAILAVMAVSSACVGSTPTSPVPSATDPVRASGSPSPSLGNGVFTPSASGTPVSSMTGGGELVALIVFRMGQVPYRARFDVRATTIIRTDAGTTTTVETTQAGVINDQDFDFQTNTTVTGVVSRGHVVAVGDMLYVKADEGAWQTADRATAASAIEVALREIRRTLNVGDLADLGTETLDGQAVHHLRITAPGAIHDPRNPLIVFDAYDLWALTDGTPVRRTEVMRVTQDARTSTYTSETRYSGFGDRVAIEAPSVARSPSPSRR